MKKMGLGLIVVILTGLTNLAGIAYAAASSNNNSQDTQQVQSSTSQDDDKVTDNESQDSEASKMSADKKNKKTRGMMETCYGTKCFLSN